MNIKNVPSRPAEPPAQIYSLRKSLFWGLILRNVWKYIVVRILAVPTVADLLLTLQQQPFMENILTDWTIFWESAVGEAINYVISVLYQFLGKPGVILFILLLIVPRFFSTLWYYLKKTFRTAFFLAQAVEGMLNRVGQTLRRVNVIRSIGGIHRIRADKDLLIHIIDRATSKESVRNLTDIREGSIGSSEDKIWLETNDKCTSVCISVDGEKKMTLTADSGWRLLTSAAGKKYQIKLI